MTKEEMKEYQHNWYLANKEIVKQRTKDYKINNKTNVDEKNKEYRENNPDKVKVWRENNVEHIKTYKRNYKQNNKENRNTQIKLRKNNDELYKLTLNIRRDISNSFKRNGYNKTSKTCEILGCTFEEFKSYIESKFKPWMNWMNYGNWNGIPETINSAWDIDHIIPLSSAKNVDEFMRLNHYTNLQPLCSYTNRNIKRDMLVTL